VRFLTTLAVSAACATGVYYAPCAYADLFVGTGAIVDLGGGLGDLACTDVIVAGTLRMSGGTLVNVRNISILPGGFIEGSGSIDLGGDWSNSGAFIPGTSSIRFRDICGPSTSTLTGSTAFWNVSFRSGIGKRYRFAVGSTQSVGGTLDIQGMTGQPIVFTSTIPGQIANIDLAPAGTQTIDHVAVTDVWSIGQWLAPYHANEGGSNARRWFGIPDAAEVQAIPAIGGGALGALALILAALGAAAVRRRRAPEIPTGGDAMPKVRRR
jgi:hypothetical protein